MQPNKVLQPRYFDAFHCIGAECEDTCCDGWGVIVDKQTYEKYENGPDEALRASLGTLITIDPKATDEDDYAKIQLNGTRCPFQSEGLCSIQVRLGEEYLSNMCATYPRMMNVAGEVLQRSLNLSCPEAARLVLLNPGRIEFEESAYQDGAFRVSKLPVLDIAGIAGEPYGFFRDVRHRVIEILQDRRYPIGDRLVMLGSFCDALDKTGAPPERIEVPAASNAKPAAQLEAVLELIVARISSDYTERRFLECYTEFMSGLKWTGKSTMDEIGGRYGEAYLKYYAPFMARHEHLMEHYLVNFAFRTLIPFGLPESNQRFTGGDASMRNAPYLWMVACYAITKTLLIGMAAQHRLHFSLDHVVKLVQSCTKTFEHSLTFPGRALAMLRANGIGSPQTARILIQNEAQRRRSSA